MPFKLLLATSASSSLIVAAMLSWMTVTLQTAPGSFDWSLLLRFWLVSWLFFAIALHFSGRLKISIEDVRQFSGKKAPTLIVRGGPRGAKVYVPLESIESVDPIRFEGPWWRLNSPHDAEAEPLESPRPGFWQRFFAVRTEGDRTPVSNVTVRGYRGEGLRITYRAATFASSAEHLWHLQIPTRHTALLRQQLSAAQRV